MWVKPWSEELEQESFWRDFRITSILKVDEMNSVLFFLSEKKKKWRCLSIELPSANHSAADQSKFLSPIESDVNLLYGSDF